MPDLCTTSRRPTGGRTDRGTAQDAERERAERQAAAGKPILDIANDFTRQPGIPLIKVESAVCNGGNTTLQFSQGEFTKDRPDKAPLRWRVPAVPGAPFSVVLAATMADSAARRSNR